MLIELQCAATPFPTLSTIPGPETSVAPVYVHVSITISRGRRTHHEYQAALLKVFSRFNKSSTTFLMSISCFT